MYSINETIEILSRSFGNSLRKLFQFLYETFFLKHTVLETNTLQTPTDPDFDPDFEPDFDPIFDHTLYSDKDPN